MVSENNEVHNDQNSSQDDLADVIIVGSGPAGYTAGIYAGRAQLKTIVFEGSSYGGSLMTTTTVENFPGFPDGIEGPDLMENMREQAIKSGAELRMEDVDAIDLSGRIKVVECDGKKYRTRSVVLAMGAAPRYLNIPGEQEHIGRGVSSCATCDSLFFRNQDVIVVGGGDSAMEEAMVLARVARSVTIVHRRSEFRASRIMLDRAAANEKISFITDTVIVSVNGESSVSSVTVKNNETGEETDLPATGFFLAIGHDPRSQLVKGQVELDDEGYVRTESRSSYTKVPGVFAAGDLVDSKYQQAISAAGMGCIAGLDVQEWLGNVNLIG